MKTILVALVILVILVILAILVIWFGMRSMLTQRMHFSYNAKEIHRFVSPVSPVSPDSGKQGGSTVTNEYHTYPLYDVTRARIGMVYTNAVIYYHSDSNMSDINYDITYGLKGGAIYARLFYPNSPSASGVIPGSASFTMNITGGSGAYRDACGTVHLVVHADGRRDVHLRLMPRLFFAHGW